MVALEDRAVAALALGDHATVAAELEALTAAHPLRERLWALRALALTRSGRQADALDALRAGPRACSPTSSASSRAPSCATCRPPCCARTRPLAWAPTRRRSGTAAARRTPGRPPRRAPSPPAPALPAWPLVGRDDQLAALRRRCSSRRARAPAPSPRSPASPGIGKSRLRAELAGVARCATAPRCCVGRCSQDDGAPAAVAVAAGAARPRARTCPRRTTATTRAARVPRLGGDRRRGSPRRRARRPLLVVLDDLHWADASTLRVLRLLAETVDEPAAAGRRDLAQPARARRARSPTPPRRSARRHALRLELAGLAAAEAARGRRGGRRRRPDRRPGRRAGHAHRRQPVLPRRVRPARPRARRPRRAAGRGATRRPRSTTCWPGGSTGCPSDRSAAALGRRDRPRVRPVRARGGRRRADEDDVLDPLDPALGGGPGARGRRRPLPVRPRAGPRHRLRRPSPTRRAAAHARVAEALAGPRRAARPRSPGTGWPPGPRTRPGLAGRRGRGRAMAAHRSTPTTRRPSCSSRRAGVAGRRTRRPRRATATTC